MLEHGTFSRHRTKERNTMHTVSLCSSGLEWDEARLSSRYAFLRRREREVRLDLLYYPYLLFHVCGTATWRFLGSRPLELLLVTDARTGKCLRVSSFPVFHEEKLTMEEEEEVKAGFVPATLESATGKRALSVHVVPYLLGREDAELSAEAFSLKAWGRRCNLPLGPRADIRCTKKESFFLYKPFWVMRPKERQKQGSEKMFIFDASTGLGGVSEYWNVVEYVLALNGTRI